MTPYIELSGSAAYSSIHSRTERLREVAQRIVQIPDAAERAAAAWKSLSEMGVPLRITDGVKYSRGSGSYAMNVDVPSGKRMKATGTSSTSKNVVPDGKGSSAERGTLSNTAGRLSEAGEPIEPSLSGTGGETALAFSVIETSTKGNATSTYFANRRTAGAASAA